MPILELARRVDTSSAVSGLWGAILSTLLRPLADLPGARGLPRHVRPLSEMWGRTLPGFLVRSDTMPR